METNCFDPGCALPASSVCECNEKITYFCDFHSLTHLNENQGTRHSIMRLVQENWSENNLRLLNYLQMMLEKSKSIKNNLLKLTQEINKEAEKVLGSILNVCAQLQKMIKSIEIRNSFIISNQGIFNFGYLKQIQEEISGYQKGKYHYFQFDDDKVYLKPEKVEKKLIVPKIVREKLYFIKYNSKTLIGFSLEKFFSIESELNFLSDSLSSPCIFQLSDDMLFVHGGRDCTWRNYYSKTFLYDVKNETYEKIDSNFPISDSRPIAFDRKVFIFGGEINRKPSISSNAFDLELKQWRSVSDLPKPLNNTSSIILNDEILITGEFNSCMYLYNVEIDTFKCISTNCSPKYYHLLVEVDGRLFIITDQIYKNIQDDLMFWQVVSSNGVRKETLISAGYFRNGFVYFADWEGNIYRFNKKTKSVDIITRIE